MQALLARWPVHPSVELVTTDGFLYPNAELVQRNLMDRKGFPESYDVRRLLSVLAELKSGAERVEVPLYSHTTYDVMTDKTMTITAADIVIVEGINVLQVPPTRAGVDQLHVSDYFDFSIYVDTNESDIERWYIERTFALRAGAFREPESFFHFLTPYSDDQVRDFACSIWEGINGRNLRENIEPTRSRADLVLQKGPDHAVERVLLRKM